MGEGGNLLLSVPLRSDGTFDEKEKAILDEFGAWMRINKESIIGTHPWTVFGEGPIASSNVKLNAQGFNEGAYLNPTSSEIRFTQTAKALYVSALAWPEDGKVTVKSLALGSKLCPQKISRVELLCYGKVPFTRDADGLVITLPGKKLNNICLVLKIRK